jgi:Ras-related protein Rab-7A
MESTTRAQMANNLSKKNHILKIVMLGDCAVGKTSIIQNYIRKSIS